MENRWQGPLWIALAASLVLFTNLGRPALWDRDEPRNAGCAREMLERGDWIVPTFNEELRPHKPVLLYWLIMSAYSVLGVTEFAARFWSAVLGVGTALLTYYIGGVLYNRETGFWAGLLLSCCLMFDVAARAATPDAALVFFSTLALAIFARGTSRSVACSGQALPGSRSVWIGMYAAMGMAVLAKGPVGVVLPTAAVGLYLLMIRPLGGQAAQTDSLGARLMQCARRFAPLRVLRTIWEMRPLTALAVVGLIAAPWYIAVGMQTGGVFLEEFFGTHNFSRFAQPMENHRGPFFYYPLAILAGMFPASVFAGPTIAALLRRLGRNDTTRPADMLLACWAGLYIVFFTLARTKLPSYVLPTYPALALLVGAFVHTWLRSPSRADRIWFRLSMGSLAVVGLGMVVGLPVAASHLLPGEEMIGVVGIAPLLAAVACLLLSHWQQRQTAMAVFGISAVAFAVTMFGFAAVRIDRHKNPKPLMATVRETSPSVRPRIAAFGHFRSTYVYYAQQRVDELSDPVHVARHFDGEADSYLIVTDEQYPQIRSSLPPDVIELDRRPRFLKEGSVILLARRKQPPVRTARRAHVLQPSADASGPPVRE